MKKRRPKDAKRNWAIEHVTDADMCPYMQRVLEKPIVTAVHAPNPNVRRFDKCPNDAAINKELSEMTKKLSGTSEYTKLYAENLVLGQVSDPKTGYAIFGVTTAPTAELITNVNFFHPVPEHLLGKFMPKDVIKPQKCTEYLHRDATHQDAIIGGVQLTYEEKTFDWIRYDPRFFVIRKWINANYPSSSSTKEEADDEEEEEEEEVKEPPPPPPVPSKKKKEQQQQKKSKVKEEKDAEDEEDKSSLVKKEKDRKSAAQRVIKEARANSVIQACSVEHPIEERRNTGFFPADFRINVSNLHKSLALTSKTDSLELIKCLIVSEQPYDFLGLGFKRWHQQSAGAALTTGNVDNVVALIRGNKSHIQTNVIQLGVECWCASNSLIGIVQEFPELLKSGRVISAMAACSEKLIALRDAQAPPTPPSRCALTGQLIASSLSCYALDFCDPTDPADILTLYVKKEFDVAQVRAAALPPTVTTELTPHGEVSYPLSSAVKKTPKVSTPVEEEGEDPMEGVTETSPPLVSSSSKTKKSIQKEEETKKKKTEKEPVKDKKQTEKKTKKSEKEPVKGTKKTEKKKEEGKEHEKKKKEEEEKTKKPPKKVDNPKKEQTPATTKEKKIKKKEKEEPIKEAEEAEDNEEVKEPKLKKTKVGEPAVDKTKKEETTLDKSQTTPFWGYLPKEWNQPSHMVLNGTPLFLSFCREAFSKPPDPILDPAIGHLLSVECDTNALRAAIQTYLDNGTMVNYPAWTACCFAVSSQFLLSTLTDDAAILDPGEHITLTVAKGCDPNHYRALPLFLAGGDRLKANVSKQAENPILKYIVSAAKPFTPVQLATARVLFQKLVSTSN